MKNLLTSVLLALIFYPPFAFANVNTASVKGELSMGGADGFIIIDIDTSDKYKERRYLLI
jgi:hypothetical protein